MSSFLQTRGLLCGFFLLLASFVNAQAAEDLSEPVDTYAAFRATFTSMAPVKLAVINAGIFDFASRQPRKEKSAASVAPARIPEPFGYRTVLAPPGALWTKWKAVEAGMSAEAPAIARCRIDARSCSSSVAQFAVIVKEAAQQQGRARLEIVNQDVNDAIAYADDIAQAKGPHSWSAPLDRGHKGAFTTGRGDCKDYAIAKYVALRESGFAARDLRLLVVRDTSAAVYHAVVAARDSGKWLILDNRWSHLIEESDATFFVPLFALSDEGVKRFAARETEIVQAPQEMARPNLRKAAPFPISDAPLLTSTLQNSSPV